jgi:hypothetical protein
MIILAALLTFPAASMLSACTTTEEVPAPEETGAGAGPCGCVAGDIECKEKCLLDLPI